MLVIAKYDKLQDNKLLFQICAFRQHLKFFYDFFF